VGKEFGISSGMAFRIARQKYEPKDPVIRTRLGLPARVEVAVCPNCGKVHMKKRCPEKRAMHKDLFGMEPEELKWRLENRE
jgi:predicted RNA-binding Zn-ribbon protein involved in translation (DUF1610 family)